MPNRAAASGREEMPQSIGKEPGSAHTHADLAPAGVRLRNVAQLQCPGTSEFFIHDGSAHDGPRPTK